MSKFIHRELTYEIIGAAMEVHSTLGPGFLEAVYQTALAEEFKIRKINFSREKPLPVFYKDQLVGKYQADFIVDEKIILELKAVSKIHPKHIAQTIHYLTSTGLKLALLLNFGAPSLEYKRVIK